jgi:hypothetical protein
VIAGKIVNIKIIKHNSPAILPRKDSMGAPDKKRALAGSLVLNG